MSDCCGAGSGCGAGAGAGSGSGSAGGSGLPPSTPFGFDSTDGVHPLDPLSPSEIKTASTATAAFFTDDKYGKMPLKFLSIDLNEPAKEILLSPTATRPPREALVLAFKGMTTIEAVVRVGPDSPRVVSHIIHIGKLAGLTEGEYFLCEEIVRSHPAFIESMRVRKLDPARVCVDPWCTGHFTSADDPDKGRFLRPLMYYRQADIPTSNIYGYPLEGITIVVDMLAEKVVEYDDHTRVDLPPVDPATEFAAPPPSKPRPPLKPLYISQPEGVSFNVTGNLVEWQRWQFRIGFTSREGVVLHHIGYRDEGSGALTGSGRIRPVVYRLSFVELCVPYADPRAPHYRKNAFDAGEDGLGRNLNSLNKKVETGSGCGCDCVGAVHFADAVLGDEAGDARVIKDAICVHEEDAGTAWRQADWRDESVEVRRARRLVVSCAHTVANYQYIARISFYMTGTIEVSIGATGVLSTGALFPGETKRKYGTVVAPGLYAPLHSHTYTVRLDMAVDGIKNRLSEVNVESETEGPHNPFGNGFFAVETPLKSELEAQRDICPVKSRQWLVRSSTTKNRMGSPTAYKLVPHAASLPHAAPSARYLIRAGFLKHNLWATKYNPREKYPPGDFPNQNPSPDGLPEWSRRDASLVDEDLVLWYNFQQDHIPSLEDWPMVQTETFTSFHLKPCGFHNSTPSIDVPTQCAIQPKSYDRVFFPRPKSKL